MTVIAMTREMGSLGKDVALELARSLDLEIVHHELVEHDIAAKLGVAESSVHKFLEGQASLRERWAIDKRKLSRFTAVEILELAQKSNVLIRGWGAAMLLKDVPHVLRVRVCAPMAVRERVMMERLGISDAAMVRREIEMNDAAHRRTLAIFFNDEWETATNYHLVLNTEHLSVDSCVRAIRLAADDPAMKETPASRAALADKLTEWRVRTAIAENRGISDSLAGLEVTVKDGHAILYGTVPYVQMAKLADQVARETPGVKDVESRVFAMRQHTGL